MSNASKSQLPKHVAIIMDGNRRWAKAKGLNTLEGHKNGVIALRKTIKEAWRLGIEYLTVYAFSTENFNRSDLEVEFLLMLISETIKREAEELRQENVRLRFIGSRDRLPKHLIEQMDLVENLTKDGVGLKLQVCVNYGGKNEILAAFKSLAKKIKAQGLSIDEINDINEKNIASELFTAGIPDPDLLIRPGGEQRISNFLVWQLAYAEIIFLSVYWPDFDEECFRKCIYEYSSRSRRFGK